MPRAFRVRRRCRVPADDATGSKSVQFGPLNRPEANATVKLTTDDPGNQH